MELIPQLSKDPLSISFTVMEASPNTSSSIVISFVIQTGSIISPLFDTSQTHVLLLNEAVSQHSVSGSAGCAPWFSHTQSVVLNWKSAQQLVAVGSVGCAPWFSHTQSVVLNWKSSQQLVAVGSVGCAPWFSHTQSVVLNWKSSQQLVAVGSTGCAPKFSQAHNVVLNW